MFHHRFIECQRPAAAAKDNDERHVVRYAERSQTAFRIGMDNRRRARISRGIDDAARPGK